MPTIQQLAAKVNGQCVEALIRNVRAMPADKADWQPLDAGRSALDQLKECAVICGLATSVLNERAFPADFGEQYGRAMAGLDTADRAIAALQANSAALDQAILAVPDADLDITVTIPWSDKPSSVAEMMFMNYWNVTYHIGQISYIQTLYGDKEMH
ncbi:MAG TPA: DinB family protein [Chthonomonadaceae bacterium]|nr:DinB family protein [Chthonomonadaceae bacterium]